MRSTAIKKIVINALACAIVFAVTLIAVPAPVVGNINLGDGALLICVYLLSSFPTAIACALGAALADIVGGYAIYVPATFIIKLLMGICVLGLSRLLERVHLPTVPARIVGVLLAECVMIAGYWIYEATVLSYGFIPAAANIPFNAIQGSVAIVLSQLALPVLEKARLLRNVKQ